MTIQSNRRLAPAICLLLLVIIWLSYAFGPVGFATADFKVAITSQLTSSPISSKVAVIIEDRPIDSLAPLILHFSAVLGHEWPIIHYTTAEATALHSAALRTNPRIITRYLPEGLQLRSSLAVSQFLTEPWFWESLAPAKHVLLFQTDSILCANSAQKVEDYFEYDFVGAPLGDFWGGESYNGGLSLRNRQMVLDIIKESNFTLEIPEWSRRVSEWKEDRRAKGEYVPDFNIIHGKVATDMEDGWLFTKMMARGASLPTREVAMKFASETIYSEYPMGYHQVQRYHGGNADEMKQINAWCPEHSLTTTEIVHVDS